MKIMKDYCDFYLKVDPVSLADVFEKKRVHKFFWVKSCSLFVYSCFWFKTNLRDGKLSIHWKYDKKGGGVFQWSVKVKLKLTINSGNHIIANMQHISDANNL